MELFLKAIRQNLKIKTFLGTNANAVKTQISTALIAMLVLRYLQPMSTFGWSLSNLAALLRHQLFVYRDLFAWLNARFEGPPPTRRSSSSPAAAGHYVLVGQQNAETSLEATANSVTRARGIGQQR